MIFAATTFLCLVLGVYDGDTIKVRCPVWPGIIAEDSLRVRGLDTPELRGKCREEISLAKEAKRLAQMHLREIEISNIDRDKYGRLLADVNVVIDGQKVNWAAYVIGRGLGRPYHGEARKPWCSNM
jgi:endonuclease YncB( thermonuclease family)